MQSLKLPKSRISILFFFQNWDILIKIPNSGSQFTNLIYVSSRLAVHLKSRFVYSNKWKESCSHRVYTRKQNIVLKNKESVGQAHTKTNRRINWWFDGTKTKRWVCRRCKRVFIYVSSNLKYKNINK